MAQSNELAEMVSQINEKISSIQNMIDSTNTNENVDIRGQMDELKALLASYESTNPTEATVADDINFALSKQSMTIEEREDLLNTKIRQIEMATERNTQTKNMLTVFIIINVVVLLVFVGLTAYDTQKIKNMYSASDSGEIIGKKAVMGALTLYLDFINLFIMLLRLFGQRR